MCNHLPTWHLKFIGLPLFDVNSQGEITKHNYGQELAIILGVSQFKGTISGINEDLKIMNPYQPPSEEACVGHFISSFREDWARKGYGDEEVFPYVQKSQTGFCLMHPKDGEILCQAHFNKLEPIRLMDESEKRGWK